MRIDPHNKFESLRPQKTKRKNSNSAVNQIQSQDQVFINTIHTMVDELSAMPETRDEMIDLGRKLANDPNYPPEEVVKSLSQLLDRVVAK